MRNFVLIYPMFAMVVLTVTVLLALFKARAGSVRRGEVSPAFYKLYQGSEAPDKSVKLARHFANIFEAPTLFYVACLGAMIRGRIRFHS